jgi:hypothetical protein
MRMDTRKAIRHGFIFLLSPLLLLWMLAGCATTPKVDWTTRIGTYTYDQTVREMGPPDRSAELSDGSVVAEWLTRRGRRHAQATGFYDYGYYPGYPYYWPVSPPVYYSETSSPDYYVRLTFDPEGNLSAAQQVRR